MITELKRLFGEMAGEDYSQVQGPESFFDLGFDSLFLTQMAGALKKRFGVKVSFRQLMSDLNSMEAVAGFLCEQAPECLGSGEADNTVAAAPSLHLPAAARPFLQAGEGTLLERIVQEQMRLMEMQLALVTRAASPTEALPFPPSRASDSRVSAAGETQAARIPASRPAQPELSADQRQYLDALIERYTGRTAKSKALNQEYRQWHADPRTASGFNPLWKEMVYQIVVTKSSGARLWDIDGNEYIDLLNGFGPSFLGHSPDVIIAALKKQLELGIEVGPQSPLAGEAAKLFCELTGNERASFVCTGSEAVYAAMRLARTVTGRDKIVVFSRDYHGNFDEVLVRAVGRPPQLRSMPVAPGIPASAVSEMYVLDYGTDEALSFIDAHAEEIAAVLIEPVQSRRPEWRPKAFIKAVRELTAARGCLMIFDEVITGLRAGPGGAQDYYGVKADLATYGKVVAGGMPIGIVAGKADYMDTFDGGFWQYGDDSFPTKGVTFFAGTFVRHPLAIAAVHAMLEYLKAQGPQLWETLDRRAERLAATVDAFFVEHGIPVRMPHFGSLMFVRMGDDQKFGNLLFYRLREKGIFLLENFPTYLTAAHTDEDVDRIIAAFQECALELVEVGLLEGSAEPVLSAPSDPALASPSPGRVEEMPMEANRFPLTEGQTEMWLASQMCPEASGTHNASNAVRLKGPLDVEILRQAISNVIARHEALRCSISSDGSELIVSGDSPFDLPVLDWRAVPPEVREERIDSFLREEGMRLFDVGTEPLFSFQVVRLSDHDHLLTFSVHMIICDGWAYNLVLEDVGTLYSLLARGDRPSLPPPTSIREYVRWQQQPERAAEITACEDFWLSRFATLPPALELPLLKTRPPKRSYLGERESLRLENGLYGALKQAAKEMQATPFAVLLAAYYAWLHRLSGQSDLVVGVPFAGQGGSGLNGLVGQCVHTLPLRVEVDAGGPFTRLLCQIQEGFLDAQEYWDYGFGRLVQNLDLPRDPSRIPLVSVIFNLDVPMDRIHFHNCETSITATPRAYFQYDLGFNLVDEGSALLVECDYNRDLFDGGSIRAWLGHFQAILQGILSDHDRPLRLLPLYLEAQQRQPWRMMSSDLRSEALSTLHEMVSAQVQRTPERVAVEFGGERLTYAELESQSNRLANLLRSLGVAPEVVVGVCLNRSPDMVVAVLAVLKAGGAYLPVDPQLPEDRMRAIVEDGGAQLLLAHGDLIQRLPVTKLRIICLDEDCDAIARESALLVPAAVLPENLAYVMFTSGSTGRPKGVEITHHSVVNFLESMRKEPGLQDHDSILALTTLSFDISVLEIFLPLLVGAKAVLVTREILVDPQQLAEVIDRHGVTVMQATPATWRMLLQAGWKGDPHLKVLCGGEAMLPDLASRLLASCGEVWNMYGPTETTVWSMVGRVQPNGPITLGRPIANTSVCVVDAGMQPVGVGVAGELLIGGEGLARGYRNLPEITAERFLSDPFPWVSEPTRGSRWYRTGDLVRCRANGEIEFVGRGDSQVKLRGHRIELEEIESVLLFHGQICDAAVLLNEEAGPAPALVAYLVLEAPIGNASLPALRSEVRHWLRGRLPDYMVPAALVFLDQLPRTAEGKKDRAKLPAPTRDAFETSENIVPPRTALEKRLLAIWSETLKTDKFGIRQSFFELGGHSLMAVALFARIEKEFGRRLPLATLLRAPTIERLALELTEKSDRETQWKSLVPVQPKGSGPPLFLVHGAGGNVLLYRALAEHLAPVLPVYGLQSRGLDGASPPLMTIEEMAIAYLKEIRSVQPTGPYYVGGYCLGGTVAYEMAQLLHAEGEEVALVALLDTYNFSRALKAGFADLLMQRLKFHLRNFLRLKPREMVRYLGEKIRIARDGEFRNILTSRANAVSASRPDGVARAESGVEASIQAINDAAAEAYLPKPYPGRITLFMPQVNYKFYPDPKMGWGDLALGGLDRVELPLNPHAMLVEPYVGTLALELKRRVIQPLPMTREAKFPDDRAELTTQPI